ncbi:hypothetical protein ABZ260_21790, partial [Streptosporangium sp. NPDC006013]
LRARPAGARSRRPVCSSRAPARAPEGRRTSRHLLEMAGDLRAAVDDYRAAASRTTSAPERDYLTTRAARLSAADHPDRRA